jgi:protein O-mannose beta-1,4-N-acetylglucosaminyltransferase
MYPDRHRLLGGVAHLPQSEQTKIIESTTVPTHFCCEDPYWLFKIYQDTTVDIKELSQLIAKNM